MRDIRIPPEILGKIYLENDLPHYPTHLGSRYPPMAVSKSWRNAALAHPRLWARVKIKGYSKLLQSSPDTLRTWLSRSKPCLLNVVLHLGRDTESVKGRLGPKDASLFETIIKVLFAQAFRLGTLDVLADRWQYSHIFQVLNRASRLHDLALRDCPHPEYSNRLETVYQTWGSASDIPHLLLQSVTNLSISLKSTPIRRFPTLDFPNLVELALQGVSIGFGDLVRMIQGMPVLALLKFDMMCRVSRETQVDRSALFQGLRTLIVQNCYMGYSFFPQFAPYSPNLVDVTLHCTSWPLLPRSPVHSVTEITLILVYDDEEDRSFSCADARNALKFCPNARKLSLTWIPDYAKTAIQFDPFIEVLRSSGEEGGDVLLKLEHLILLDTVLSMSCVLETLEARSSGAFKTLRNDEPFYLTLEGCYGLPDVRSGTFTQVKQLFEDPPEINMTFSSCEDPYVHP